MVVFLRQKKAVSGKSHWLPNTHICFLGVLKALKKVIYIDKLIGLEFLNIS
ncbi:MAG TPA: hypothetical protein GX745_04095 [Clostridiales bacterium]|nr:hypothetical protein [Clostridiales bacterium]